MNPDPDKQADELQRMLALKRHETPPPRFFRGLSEKVMDRLHSPESPGPQTFWQRLGLDIDSRPVLVCAIGVTVCGLLVIGLIASLRMAPPKRTATPATDPNQLVVAPVPSTQPTEVDPSAPNGAGTRSLSDPITLTPSTSPTPLKPPVKSPSGQSNPEQPGRK